MTGTKMVQQDSYSTVIVLASGQKRTIKVQITEGYTTKDDIASIVNIAFPGAMVECFGLYSTELVPDYS
jgi:hypothetical protein